jgi:hypothetical protein
MTKVIQNLDGLNFGISSSFDMYSKLLNESARLQTNWENAFDAFNFFVTAWHLYHDWVKCEHKGSLSRIKRHRTQIPKEMIFVLNIVKDLTNGSKHFSLSNEASTKRVINKVHDGKEYGFYEFFFRENIPGVDAKSDQLQGYFSIRVLHNIVMKYFDWVFDDGVKVDDFPLEIVDAITYCDLINRTDHDNVSEAARELL